MSEELTARSAAELERRGKRAWRTGDATLLSECIRVLASRRTAAAKSAMTALKDLGPADARNRSGTRGKPPRAWIQKAARIAETFDSDNDGDASVYVVLFERDGDFGLYVGSTGIPVSERFRNHKNGYKASRIVRDYGTCVLYEVGKHLHGSLSRARADVIEGRLFNALKRAGFIVAGGQ